MISETFRWWLTIEALGLLVLPIVFVVFQRLPGRGFAFAKPAGLLLGGYLFWMALSLQLLPNRPGSIVWALLPLAIVSGFLLRSHWREMREFAGANSGYIFAVEAVFFAGLFAAAHVKSFLPEIAGTEKPMDFMFLNAASRSQYYPPDDPWLAGSGVSYYYFGYVINAMAGKLAALPTAVTFNLALAGTAALAATATFGLGYEIARLVRGISFRPAIAVGAGAVLLLAVIGNLEGVIEFGIANDVVDPNINETVAINDLETARISNDCLIPLPGSCLFYYPSDESSFWWWWRATRLSPDGNSITEFPFFSFILGDLHPHVMAIPFVLTVFGLALSFWATAGRLDHDVWRRNPWLLLMAALLLGGLGFLNTWDLPTFGFLLAALVLARNYLVERLPVETLKDTATFMAPLAALAFLLYAPFYLSFSTQASGLDTVVNGATRPLHSALFWGVLVIVNLPLPLALLARGGFRRRRGDVMLALAVPVVLLLAWAVLTIAGHGFGAVADAVGARGYNWFTYVFFAAVLAAALLALRRQLDDPEAGERSAMAEVSPADPARDPVSSGVVSGPIATTRVEPESNTSAEPALSSASTAAAAQPDAAALTPVLIAMSTGLLLILGAELFYVQDVFSSRLNTVFKLSYQAWMLLAISGGYSFWWLLSRWQPAANSTAAVLRGSWSATALIVLAGGLLYPVGATLARTGGLNAPVRTLDGLQAARRASPDDFAAITWLRDRAGQDERIVEGTGGQYSSAGRVSAFTGIPTVLGWLGHEVQWGRDGTMLSRRQADIDLLYSTESMEDALRILQQYQVSYVFVGRVERAKYPPAGLDKFAAGLPIAGQFGETLIYRVPRPLPDPTSADAP